MEWADPPVLPYLRLPEAPTMPAPVLEVPRASIPSYTPLVVPPSDLRPPPGIKGKEDEGQQPTKKPPTPVIKPPVPPEAFFVEVPGTDFEVPLPSPTILTTAATTAFVSVAATLTATSIFKHTVTLLKPVIKQAWTRITKKKNQPTNPS